MGSGKGSVPLRQIFSWDLKNPPWTGGHGDQEMFYDQAVWWKELYDALDSSNYNKNLSNIQDILPQSQPVERALDLVKEANREVVRSDNGAMLIAKAIHKQDTLSFVTYCFQ